MSVVLVGLGPIGLDVGRALVARGATILGAADPAPGLAGVELSTLVPGVPDGTTIAADAAALYARARRGDVAVLCTGSRLPAIAGQLEAAIAAGLHVVSTCEELACPTLRNPELAAALDAHARAQGVSIVGTGVNPGLVMDRLPLTLAAGCVAVEHVTIERVVDAGRRRGPLRAKVGAGLTEAAFRSGVAAGRLGHVGLAESAALVAAGLGLPVAAVDETIEPVLDPETGLVLGVRQTAAVRVDGTERVRLELAMFVGASEPHDRIVIAGDPPVDLIVIGGFQGDRATFGTVVNAVATVAARPPGLAAEASARPRSAFLPR
jgi:4-hydroxy-tetrahydrodipicolinate reductase